MRKVTHYIPFCLSALLLFCSTPLSAQTPSYDYHPYKCAQEEQFINSEAFRERHESSDCGLARELIRRFYSAEARGDETEKFNLQKSLSFVRCAESFLFFENQIHNSRFETDRCNAVISLAWLLEPEYLPTIQQYARKTTLSILEKSAAALALMIYGVFENDAILKQQSLTLLEGICDEATDNVLENCVLSFILEGGNAAINFFSSQFQQEKNKLYAAVNLAQLGEHKQTFPIFTDALDSEDNYEIHLAIMGFAYIGSEEAMKFLLNLDPEKNRYHPQESRWNFEIMNFKEGGRR